MTMPHLMNCPHSDSGWCLDCVKAEHDSCKRYADILGQDLDIAARRMEVAERACDQMRRVAMAAVSFLSGDTSLTELMGVVDEVRSEVRPDAASVLEYNKR